MGLEAARETAPRTAGAVLEHGRALDRLRARMPRKEGAVWVVFALAAPRFFGPVFTIVLRRFLGPAASGTFDLAYTPYRFLDNFRTFGTGPALVFERSVSRAAADTAWTLNMVCAILITVVAQLIAHPAAMFYGHPAIEGVLRILSIAYVFASISSVHMFLLMRDLDFRSRAIPALGQVVAGGTVAVMFAVWGFGVGTLVSRELTSVIVGSILLWAVYPYRPHLRLVPDIAVRLLRYGSWIGAGLTLLYLSQNVDIFVGGRIIHNAGQIGFYTTSWRLAFIASGVLTTVASSMVFATLSRLQHDLTALRECLLTAIRQIGLIMFPSSALLAVLAPVLIVPLLGNKWAPYRASFLVLSLLAVYAGNRTMLAIFFEGYKSVGKPWIVPVYNAVKLAVMIPAMVFGAEHGILGMAVMYIPVQLLEFPIALLLARRVLQVHPLAVWRVARIPVAATAVMTLLAAAAELTLHRMLHQGDVVTLVVSGAVAITVYVIALFVIDRRVLLEARTVLLQGF